MDQRSTNYSNFPVAQLYEQMLTGQPKSKKNPWQKYMKCKSQNSSMKGNSTARHSSAYGDNLDTKKLKALQISDLLEKEDIGSLIGPPNTGCQSCQCRCFK